MNELVATVRTQAGQPVPDGSTLSIFHFVVVVVVRRCKAAIDGNRKFNRGSVEILPVSPVDPACWLAVRGMVAAAAAAVGASFTWITPV